MSRTYCNRISKEAYDYFVLGKNVLEREERRCLMERAIRDGFVSGSFDFFTDIVDDSVFVTLIISSDNIRVKCSSCGWSGTNVEVVAMTGKNGLIEYHCPRCDKVDSFK